MIVLLLSLSVKNLGLFKESTVNFSENLNVITGESGTGKSMFIEALNTFITGNIPNDLRNQEGNISAYFLINKDIKNILNEYFDFDSEEIIISANFTSKRTIFRINNIIAPKEVIQNIGKYLIEMHSQDSSIVLRDDKYQNIMIHNLLIEKFPNDFSEYNILYKKYTDLKNKLNKIPDDPSHLYREIDILDYQINEIQTISPKIGEDDELNEKFKALNNIETIKDNIYESLNILKENEFNLDEMIGNVVHNTSKLTEFGFKNEYDFSLIIQSQLIELYDSLEDKLNEIELDEEELQNVTERLNNIINLKRKYGPSLDDVLNKLEKMIQEKNELNELKDLISEIEPQIILLEKQLKEVSQNLLNKSKPYLLEIKNQIEENLKDLNMTNASIDYYFEEQKKPNILSFYKMKFLLKTNPQSDYMSLSKIASGGEMSRILLSIEAVLGKKHAINTMLFDEIDSGVGPRMADVVAKKIKDLSLDKQVIVITHMPQVANIGQKHFKIVKNYENNQMFSDIIELDDSEKEKEIKDMYGNIVY